MKYAYNGMRNNKDQYVHVVYNTMQSLSLYRTYSTNTQANKKFMQILDIIRSYTPERRRQKQRAEERKNERQTNNWNGKRQSGNIQTEEQHRFKMGEQKSTQQHQYAPRVLCLDKIFSTNRPTHRMNKTRKKNTINDDEEQEREKEKKKPGNEEERNMTRILQWNNIK